MRILSCMLAIGLGVLAAGADALAQQALPDGFAGKFRGRLTGSGGFVTGEFTVSISKIDGGFMVAWPPRISASFEAAGRPGVFNSRERTRILEGEPVYWARLENATLIVYSAQIDELGGYRIDSYLYTLSDNGLALVIRRVVTGAEPLISSGRLSRYSD